MKLPLKIALLFATFTVASAATYVAIHRWKADGAKPNAIKTSSQQDTLEGVDGLAAGEIVNLPELKTLAGETVSLGTLGRDRLLCVFISSRCPGCTRDANLWHMLDKEAQNRSAAFYVINVGDELPEIEKFVSAYSLQQLSILFDPGRKVGPQLKIGFLPQYILFDRNGQVLHRWDGIRRYDKGGGSEQLAEFFQPE